jgi:hypothetical protein
MALTLLVVAVAAMWAWVSSKISRHGGRKRGDN